jgi:hypothetical protein
MLRQAQHKNQGSVPAACAEPVEAMENPALDWRAVLEMHAGRTQERMLALSLPKGCNINRRRCTELVEVLHCASRTRRNWMLALRLVLSLSKHFSAFSKAAAKQKPCSGALSVAEVLSTLERLERALVILVLSLSKHT